MSHGTHALPHFGQIFAKLCAEVGCADNHVYVPICTIGREFFGSKLLQFSFLSFILDLSPTFSSSSCPQIYPPPVIL